jgi:DNA-binding SARP family transcriptional activator/tetratricopeptide (TPR) repeat protein
MANYGSTILESQPDSMHNIQLFFLGPIQFRRDGSAVELRAAKAAALLAYLAAHPAPQRRERLIDLLWPESSPEAARKNLRNTLWTIGKALGEEIIEADGDSIRLSPHSWVDLHQFTDVLHRLQDQPPLPVDALREAAGLYRGPFLDGIRLSEAPDFELWLATQRDETSLAFLRILEALVDHYRAAGDWSLVITTAQRALAVDPLHEPMMRILMKAHALRGERGEALRLYDTLHRRLTQELGVGPLPETQRLRDQILAGELTNGAAPPSFSPGTTAKRLSSAGLDSAQASVPPFIGRRSELAALDAEFDRAAQGSARIALLTGELGIGKTRLWQEWSANLPAKAHTLATRAIAATKELPFAPVVDLLRHPDCFNMLFSQPSPVPVVWRMELARLLPEIASDLPAIPPPSLPVEEERHRLFEALIQALRALHASPLVLFVDDIHWADRATLDWLGYLVHRLRAEPLLLIGAYRPADAPTYLIRMITNWQREGLVRRIALPRFTEEETQAYLAAMGSDLALATELAATSVGNPYFLTELSRADQGQGACNLAELLHNRVLTLPDTARQVLQAAAVLEAGADFPVLRRTSGRSEEETLDALDLLLSNGMLVENQGRYQIVHPSLAHVALEGMSLARRSFLHRRAAQALEVIHRSQLPEVAGQLARHYREAGAPEKTARYAEMAADHAMTLAAPDEAVSFLRLALQSAPNPARRAKLGNALVFQGALDEGRQFLEEALRENLAAGDQREVVQTCLNLANSYLVSGQRDMVVYWAEKALEHYQQAPDPALHAQIHFLLGAGTLHSRASYTTAEAHLRESIRLAMANDLKEAEILGRFELGNLLAQRGDLALALESYQSALALARQNGDRLREMLALNNLAYHTLLSGDPAAAQGYIDEALSLVEEQVFFFPRTYLYSTQGEILLARGEVDAAKEWLQRSLTEAESYSNLAQAANVRATLGLAAQTQGDLDLALELLDEAHRTAAMQGAKHLQMKIGLWLVELYQRRGEHVAARELLGQLSSELAESGHRRLQAKLEQLRSAAR